MRFPVKWERMEKNALSSALGGAGKLDIVVKPIKADGSDMKGGERGIRGR